MSNLRQLLHHTLPFFYSRRWSSATSVTALDKSLDRATILNIVMARYPIHAFRKSFKRDNESIEEQLEILSQRIVNGYNIDPTRSSHKRYCELTAFREV